MSSTTQSTTASGTTGLGDGASTEPASDPDLQAGQAPMIYESPIPMTSPLTTDNVPVVHLHNGEPPHPHTTSLREPPCCDILPGGTDQSSSSRRRQTLAEFRRSEGPAVRASKLRALWASLPVLPTPCSEADGETPTKRLRLPGQDTISLLSAERAERLRKLYEEELARRVTLEKREEASLWGGDDNVLEPGREGIVSVTASGSSSLGVYQPQPEKGFDPKQYKGKGIDFKDFRRFLWDQEKMLWDKFQELDKDCDGRLESSELRSALKQSGIELTDSTFKDFVTYLASGSPASRITPSSVYNASHQLAPAPTPSSSQSSSTSASSTSTPPATPASPASPPPIAHAENTYITFAEFRDFLILLPRRASVEEIYKFYQVKRRGDGRGAARLNMDGDVSLSFPRISTSATPSSSASGSTSSSSSSSLQTASSTTSPNPDPRKGKAKASPQDEELDTQNCRVDHSHDDPGSRYDHEDEAKYEEDEEDEQVLGMGENVAWKFLLAGGVAGAISRTATAPFDRLKIYLITATDTPTLKAGTNLWGKASQISSASSSAPATVESVKRTLSLGKYGLGSLQQAVINIYKDGGGLKAFWVGNGLNVTKIFPESAIKFFSYEYSKRVFAKYWDHVQDQTDISGTSRFISGGIGGITSQLSIYPIETLKTQLQSSVGSTEGQLMKTALHMWRNGGMRAYYRGLTLGLVGVFPYSAIDMSTFEALKIAYCKSFEVDEPQTMAVLCFGAMSGSIGATSVYPINLLRTRLQASGSSGHPQVYTGFLDVTQKTLAREGWQGLYKGLLPTILKVAPAVSISYVVYEHCKRSLHIH